MSRNKEFDFDSLPQGSKDVYELRLKAPDLTRLADVVRMTCGDMVSPDAISDAISARLDADSLLIPVLAVKGASGQGKTLVATAGVHGDEYEGMEAIFRTFEALDPSNLSGTFVAVPVVTLPAFWQATRANPVDGLNMARIFPGSSSGSMSERLAALMLEKVFRHADLYIDLHSSGRNYAMMTLVGYAALGRQAETGPGGSGMLRSPHDLGASQGLSGPDLDRDPEVGDSVPVHRGSRRGASPSRRRGLLHSGAGQSAGVSRHGETPRRRSGSGLRTATALRRR